jgi:antitoxin YefM
MMFFNNFKDRKYMNILTFSEARAGLKTVMDNVCKDHAPAVITRVNGEHVVMLSLADYNSIEETMYLLSSAKNASRLMESIAQLRDGKARPRELIRNEKQESAEQAASQE